ncbi:Shedu anti-phage system protein SduA domain-containing protein [Yinghuangia sp. YIM S10712]|uniref:Shedu anti-phage system protein SduA domain-containing protein n=1 Tax=Yinghuangia sp. YIM S10712 TaxID=3436930 RepID=UPI003F53BB48
MTVRSDWTLELQLEIVRKEADQEDVKAAVDAVFDHMGNGGRRNRRGGKELVRLLEDVRARAATCGEWQVVRLVQDSLDYAEGRILKPDFEERYRLFQDGERNEHHRELVAGVQSIIFEHVAEAGRKFLLDTPDAGAEEVLAYISSLSEEMKYLDAPSDRPGRYRVLRGRAEMAVWLQRALAERTDIESPSEAARRIVTSPEALTLLAADSEGQLLFRAAELQRRSAGLSELRRTAEDTHASELDLQRALTGQCWIFGGRFVEEFGHRRLVDGDEFDIPLVRGDGALHIVELKRAMGMRAPLIKSHRGAWVPASAVHEAVGQAMNYLVGLDENRHCIRDDFGIETRRASALVLIGHPGLHPQVPENEINEALRTFNTHLSRVEVMTYKELIDNAQRSLGGPPAA